MSTLDAEEELHRELCSYFRGSAKIRLAHLEPEEYNCFNLDEGNVTRLQEVFTLQGCLRLNPEHHIRALISNETLEGALHASGRRPQDLYELDEFKDLALGEEVRVTVLQGRHRVRAAKRFCVGDDRWWVVDLYDDRLPQHLVKLIREEYPNSRKFCDGDIYRQLRYHQLRGNAEEEGKWLARLTAGKRKDIKQLQDKNERLSNALDRLWPIIGLWASLKLGILHRILPMRCPIENTNYVDNMDRIWTYILEDKNEFGCLVDPLTVKRLEMRTPKLSTDDADEVRKMMDDGLLFPQIRDPATRAGFLTRLENLSEPVLSLYTYAQGTILWDLGAKPLRLLLPPDWRGSLRESFHDIRERMDESPQITIQRSEHEFIRRNCPRHLVLPLTFAQLFLYTTRDFASLTEVTPRKEPGKLKPVISTTMDSLSLWGLADLAYRLGFRSDQITALRDRNPDMQMARNFLRQIRPTEAFDFASTDRETLVQDICRRLTEVPRRTEPVQPPIYTTDLQKQPLSHRCGRPFDDGYQIDRKHLFIENIYGNYNPRRAKYLTSLALKRYTFIAFFGNFNIEPVISSVSSQNGPAPNPGPATGPAPNSGPATGPAPDPGPATGPALDPGPATGPAPNSGPATGPAPNSGPATGPAPDPGPTPGPSQNPHYRPPSSIYSNSSDTERGRIFHSLAPGETVMSLIREHRDSRAAGTPTLFYLWETYMYTFFAANDASHCEQFAQVLANRGHFFVTLKSPEEISTTPIKYLWLNAQPFRIIMAGPKQTEVTSQEPMYGGKNLNNFLKYLERKPLWRR